MNSDKFNECHHIPDAVILEFFPGGGDKKADVGAGSNPNFQFVSLFRFFSCNVIFLPHVILSNWGASY